MSKAPWGKHSYGKSGYMCVRTNTCVILNMSCLWILLTDISFCVGYIYQLTPLSAGCPHPPVHTAGCGVSWRQRTHRLNSRIVEHLGCTHQHCRWVDCTLDMCRNNKDSTWIHKILHIPLCFFTKVTPFVKLEKSRESISESVLWFIKRAELFGFERFIAGSASNFRPASTSQARRSGS